MKHISYWLGSEDIPDRTREYQKLISSLKCEEITDVELWEVAQNHQAPPHLGNIYMLSLFERIKTALIASYPDLQVDYFINALDSHLYINGEEIFCEDDFWRIVQNAADINAIDANTTVTG